MSSDETIIRIIYIIVYKLLFVLYAVWKVSVVGDIQSKCGKIGTRKTPNMDTFKQL